MYVVEKHVAIVFGTLVVSAVDRDTNKFEINPDLRLDGNSISCGACETPGIT